MKIEKVKAIVLSETSYSESSKILTCITKEHGKIGIISKGCKNLKSKLRSVSVKLTYGIFDIYYKKDGLSTLISVDVINDFKNAKQDLLKLGCIMYLLDLTKQVLNETNSEELFNILESALIKINDGFDSAIITNIVELKYLSFLGVLPVLDECCLCGSHKDIVTISGSDGGYICKNCFTNQYITDEKTIKLLRMFYYVDISKIKELNISSRNKTEINEFLESYYTKYTGLYLKSKNFLNQIK